MTSRREFFLRAASVAATVAVSRGALAQDSAGPQDVRGSADQMPGMEGTIRPVRLPPKPGAKPVLTQDDRDALEHRIHCQCGTCTLDIFTCRTTDFTCQISPAMHRDVVSLVEGGYSAQEILDAFVGTYGERVLMAPKKSNVLAWFTPGVAVVVGGGVIAMFLKRWKSERPTLAPIALTGVDATPEELARLEAVLKGDDRP
jgi:cytochrome c-type biogenesis protein CcmH